MGNYNVTAEGRIEGDLIRGLSEKFLAAAGITAERIIDEEEGVVLMGDGIATVKVPMTGLQLYACMESADHALASQNVVLVIQLAFHLGYLHARGLADEEMAVLAELYDKTQAQYA